MRPDELFNRAVAPAGSEEDVPRVTTVFAHPDDECIALGSRLSRLRQTNFLYATDGSPANGEDAQAQGFVTADAYRVARQSELQKAFATSGLETSRTAWLGFGDQTAALHLEELTERVKESLLRDLPQVAFTHPYEGGHPDHDACAFAVQHALLDMEPEQRPLVIEAAFYHQGPEGIETARFLPEGTSMAAEFHLNAEEQGRRSQLLACFESQRETLAYFSRLIESFRVAPGYDFSKPPHAGRLFYENFDWGMTAERFCQLATAAERSLAKREETTCL